jgi:signal recognition particle subunit SRP19
MGEKEMRKQDKAIIWPAYFDQTKTRKNGRRVTKNQAVPNPNIDELQEAARRLGLKPEVAVDLGYPKTPWQKTGMLKVEKKAPKEQIIKNIAKQLLKARSATPAQQK